MIAEMVGGIALACTMREVQPMPDAPTSKPVAATLTVAGRSAAIARMPSLVDLAATPVRGARGGGFHIDGARTRSGEQAWAELAPTNDGGFTIEWRIRNPLSREGRWTVAPVARGTCRLRNDKPGAGA